MTLIHDFMPRARLRQVERVRVPVPPTEAWSAARAVDTFKLSLFRWLIGIRVLPERAVARLRGRDVPLPEHSTIDDIVKEGKFGILAEQPGAEIVIGAIGKFWLPEIEWAHVAPADFARFDEPGWGKVVWNLRVDPADPAEPERGAWLTCELRVTATDEASWRRFRRYWRLIGPFSHTVRKALLRKMAVELGGGGHPERWRPLPGDEILPEARFERTHEQIVEVPPARLWPWLVQMGCRRAGWYSIDILDNGGVKSAERIIPELQKIAVGDLIPASPKETEGFVVARVDLGRALVLRGEAKSSGEKLYRASWAFVLAPIGDEATELTVRVRGDYEPSLKVSVVKTLVAGAHEIMEWAQLRNLKRRAESVEPLTASTPSAP